MAEKMKTIFEIEKEIQEKEVKKICAKDEEKAEKIGINLKSVCFLPEPIHIISTLYPLACPTLEYMWRTDEEGNTYEINMAIAKIVGFYNIDEQKPQKPIRLFSMGDALYAENEGRIEKIIFRKE